MTNHRLQYIFAIIVKIIDGHSTFINVVKFGCHIELNPFSHFIMMALIMISPLYNDMIWIITLTIIQTMILCLIITLSNMLINTSYNTFFISLILFIGVIISISNYLLYFDYSIRSILQW